MCKDQPFFVRVINVVLLVTKDLYIKQLSIYTMIKHKNVMMFTCSNISTLGQKI